MTPSSATLGCRELEQDVRNVETRSWGRAQEEDSASVWEAQRRRSWARLLRRIYEVDPLRCPCGGELKIVSVITDPVVGNRMLAHRKAKEMKSPFATRAPPPAA